MTKSVLSSWRTLPVVIVKAEFYREGQPIYFSGFAKFLACYPLLLRSRTGGLDDCRCCFSSALLWLSALLLILEFPLNFLRVLCALCGCRCCFSSCPLWLSAFG